MSLRHRFIDPVLMLVVTFVATSVFGAVTGHQVSASRYLELMESAVSAYSAERLDRYLSGVEREGVQEHGFPRLAANLGVLVANGRQNERREILRRMLDVACRDAAKGMMPPRSGGNEFSVQELVVAVAALEKAKVYAPAVTDRWRKALSSIVAENVYTTGRLPTGGSVAKNWVVFAAASEQARIAHGMGGDPAFVEKYVVDQLRWFDANGMYRDPDQPSVYDFVTRLQFMHLLDWGYDGSSRVALEAMLDKSSEPTLKMLSAAGEIPYGGRSNQFLHNHTFYAAVCEWYAARYVKAGRPEYAARFAEAAWRATEALRPWLEALPVRHVKNRYDGNMGCEDYAYFDKYMVTMGSWAMGALGFVGDGVRSSDVPVTSVGPYVFATTPDFHFVVLSAGDYSAQFDYRADAHYDCDGLGRVQRRGAPAAICLSTPCARKPNYRIECENDGELAIAPVVDGGLTLTPVDSSVTNGCAKASWRIEGRPELFWDCSLSARGLLSTLQGKGRVELSLPAFAFDGREATVITGTTNTLTVGYHGWKCVYTTDGEIVDSGHSAHNRNGCYRRFLARGTDRIMVSVRIEM